MTSYLVLASGFASSQFHREFGVTYSALIPVHGEPVLRTILQGLPIGSDLTVTIPSGCAVVAHEVSRSEGARVVEVHPDQTLGEAMRLGLEDLASNSQGPVVVLFGDTVIDFTLERDSIAVCAFGEGHPYTTVELDETGTPQFIPKADNGAAGKVFVGAFSISDPKALLTVLGRHVQAADVTTASVGSANDVSFFEALRQYGSRHPMRLVSIDGWSDAGHLRSWSHVRERRFEAREFNRLQLLSDGFVRKESDDLDKLQRELEWFRNVPDAVRIHCPAVRPTSGATMSADGYDIEYIPAPTLGERLVWGHHLGSQMAGMLGDLLPVLVAMRSARQAMSVSRQSQQRYSFYVDATLARLRQFDAPNSPIPIDQIITVNGDRLPPLISVVNEMQDVLRRSSIDELDCWSVMHGDFFLGNLIGDPRDSMIKMIDPRGSFGAPGLFGDPLYDLAKLSHSLLGHYDSIVAGLFSVRARSSTDFNVNLIVLPNSGVQESEGRSLVEEIADRLGVGVHVVRAIESLIFLRMLSLHGDSIDRQRALVSRAYVAREAALRVLR